ncbi:hypothetical protein EVAR_56196_1 [Eumeta japonica]|uniref:Uncharacterized protein n=1 Tax=Eumeta variegata TaxID=151549 RepID=A0A4C1Y719_EUMVA|nr:hypothetical protein EVAR_56196_1 [Eumeta japonica]
MQSFVECTSAIFGGVGGGPMQRVPFVYLPLKGQIIHPSNEITFPGVKTPVCAVSGAQYLGRKGLAELRGSEDADVPFSLFRDEGRTFLQWAGEEPLRVRMAGRVVLVRLLCRDMSAPPAAPLDLRGVFTPCVAFRVQGSPATLPLNVSEVQFASNAHTANVESTSGLSVSEYVAIGISSLLLGLIYVASIFLYLHIRKKRRNAERETRRCSKNVTKRDGTVLTEHDIVRISNDRIQTLPNALEPIDEVIVKKNPLMSMARQFNDIKSGCPSDSGSNVSDSEDLPESSERGEDSRYKNQTTSVIVHPNHRETACNEIFRADAPTQAESNIERLPDEHVSIVETSEDTPSIARPVGTTRRKLYFNPAYFEPQLMAEPPPAALEFLTKIREVITIAKHKMAAKRFHPILNEIPEEETYLSGGCPGCKLGKAEFPSIVNYEMSTCSNCVNRTRGDKQTIIREWLENIPPVKEKPYYNETAGTRQNSSLINSLLSLPSAENRTKIRKQNSFNIPHNYTQETEMFALPRKASTLSVRSEPSIRNYNLPLPDFDNVEAFHKNYGRTVSRVDDIRPIGLSDYKRTDVGHNFKNDLPDMINEAIALENCSKSYGNISSDEEKFYNKIRQTAVATVRPFSESPQGNDYETDSLERTSNKKGLSPTESTDISSAQASPSLSAALPLEEELTMHNAIYKNSSTASNTPSPNRDEDKNHFYEIIDKKDVKDVLHKVLYEKPKGEYNLVSEVYVNNNYNFGSVPTSPSSSECSMGSRKLIRTTRNDKGQKPGSLTIEVKDSPDNYIKIHESDGFEPDTLDRKQQKQKDVIENNTFSGKDHIDQLDDKGETPISQRFQLRSSGTFKRETSNKEDKFNSLRHVYEQRNSSMNSPDLRASLFSGSRSLEDDSKCDPEIAVDWNSEEGRILTLELRHSKRQRQCTPPTIKQLKSLPRPDVLPPLPPTDSIYEQPTYPPRRVEIDGISKNTDSKNVSGRSLSPRTLMNNMITEKINAKTDNALYSVPSCSKKASVRPINSDYELMDSTGNLNPSTLDIRKSSNERRTQSLSKQSFVKPLRDNIDTNTFNKEHSKFKGKLKKKFNIEDSGYLSSESNNSKRIDRKIIGIKIVSCSESEDTENEARSESGAESVETHSVFFGSFRDRRKSDSSSSFDRKRNKRHSNKELKPNNIFRDIKLKIVLTFIKSQAANFSFQVPANILECSRKDYN